jgi:hypothetical protein
MRVDRRSPHPLAAASREFFAAYLAARREFMTDVATAMGCKPRVVDVAGDMINLEVVRPGVR